GRSAWREAAMPRIKEAVSEFLASKRIAVTGVSRDPKGGHGSNAVYQRLRQRGYEVFAVNPNAEQVEGDRCYPDPASNPGGGGGGCGCTGAPAPAPSQRRPPTTAGGTASR